MQERRAKMHELEAVREAANSVRRDAEEKDKLARQREGIIEALKLEHNWHQHLGTISIAAIAAFGAILGGAFPNPQHWDSTWEIIQLPVNRAVLISLIFIAFLAGAVGAGVGALSVRNAIEHISRAETTNDIDRRRAQLRGLRSTLQWMRALGTLFFGVGLVLFLIFIDPSTPNTLKT
jgi:hypothetical protein